MSAWEFAGQRRRRQLERTYVVTFTVLGVIIESPEGPYPIPYDTIYTEVPVWQQEVMMREEYSIEKRAMAITKTFPSSEVARTAKGEISDLHITLYPHVPMVEIKTDRGRPCVLRGEDLGAFIAWMKEQDFKIGGC